MLNALMIEQIQSHPDTTITLYNGKKLVVKTDEEEVVRKITSFYQKIGLVGHIGVVENDKRMGGMNE